MLTFPNIVLAETKNGIGKDVEQVLRDIINRIISIKNERKQNKSYEKTPEM